MINQTNETMRITTLRMRTSENKKINTHVYHSKGRKTVCVSTCLNFFGIAPDKYSYTSSDKNVRAYENVLRRFGFSVRSRKSEFKAMKYPTTTTLKRQMKKSDYTSKDLFIVAGFQSKTAHLMIFDGEGNTIIDTAPNSKWHIAEVSIVENKAA